MKALVSEKKIKKTTNTESVSWKWEGKQVGCPPCVDPALLSADESSVHPPCPLLGGLSVGRTRPGFWSDTGRAASPSTQEPVNLASLHTCLLCRLAAAALSAPSHWGPPCPSLWPLSGASWVSRSTRVQLVPGLCNEPVVHTRASFN